MSGERDNQPRTFFVETRFQKMARRPGGLLRDEALRQASANLETLKPQFELSLEPMLQSCIEATRSLNQDFRDPAKIALAFDLCRELRNAAEPMGYQLLSFVCMILCDMLSRIGAGAAYDQEAVECVIDALVLASGPPYNVLSPGQVPELTSGLQRIAERTGATL